MALANFKLPYPEPGSNRHGLPHWCLRPARLPIPPSGPFSGCKGTNLFLIAKFLCEKCLNTCTIHGLLLPSAPEILNLLRMEKNPKNFCIILAGEEAGGCGPIVVTNIQSSLSTFLEQDVHRYKPHSTTLYTCCL